MTDPQKAAHVELAEALETVTRTLARVTEERDQAIAERDSARELLALLTKREML